MSSRVINTDWFIETEIIAVCKAVVDVDLKTISDY